MSYSRPVRAIQEWLRSRVSRDTTLWRALVTIKTSGLALESRLRAASWARAEREFGDTVDKLAAANSRFFFVQVGAHDGAMDDPLARWIAQHGWRGLFIEPQPEQFARLRARYAGKEDRFIFENIAIDRTPGERDLFRVAEDHLHAPEMSGLASLLPDRALTTHAALGRLTHIRVPCAPLQSVLDRHGITEIDLLQIDTEGYDAVVLETLDLDRTRPRLIHYEHRHLSDGEQAACARRLRRHGYSVRMKQFDAFAARK